MAAKPISQSDTRWVKKEGKRGYVEQVSTGKRVTGRVALVKNTTKGKAGTTQRYKAGTGLKQTGKPSKPKGAGPNPKVITPKIIIPVDPPNPPAPTGGSKAATRRNEIAAAGRMRSQNAAKAITPSAIAARKKTNATKAKMDAAKRRAAMRLKARTSESKASKDRFNRPSLKGAIRNINSYGDKTAADYIKFSQKNTKAMLDYFR